MPTTSPSIRAQVGVALADRLATITRANGYDHDIKAVHFDVIPMGMDQAPEDLPVIYLIDEGGLPRHEHQVLDIARSFRLQLVHTEVSDVTMDELLRAVGKAIWANSPTAETTAEFRFHPRVYQVEMGPDETDLQMVQGNRIATVQVVVHYRTKPFDL